MTLPAGTRLGPYEIVAPLGAGGMGEVYRARDTRLGRDVAIKVLPEQLAADEARLARFEQEARAASALNHPNVVTIYDVGQFDATSYIAMELVEGRTLRELVAAEPLPLRKVLAIAPQIADGLAKAHVAGIVHRDLKLDNVMVSKDGFVKILDFGLAKLVLPETGGLSVMPTAAGPATQPGVVMGTMPYMSPEQAAGQAVDWRTDQFSFGSILYELITGRRPFEGKTGPETLAAIIREEPKPIGELRSETPAPLVWIIERCLAKDPENRYASTRDLARDLAGVRDRISQIGSGPASPAAPQRAGGSPTKVALAAAAFALLVATAAFIAGRRSSRSAPPTYRQLTFRRGTMWSARFAPDGETVVYSAAWESAPVALFSTRIGSPESRLLGLPSAQILSISSSGEMAVLLQPIWSLTWFQFGMLARASLAGGEPRPLLERAHGADWSPRGEALAVLRSAGGKSRLELPAGTALYETDAGLSHVRVSPDGSRVAVLEHDRSERTSVLVLPSRRGAPKKISDGWDFWSRGLAWSPDGSEIWFTASRGNEPLSLYAATLAGRLRLVSRLPNNMIVEDIDRNGRLLVSSLRERIGLKALRQGEVRERELSWLDNAYLGDLSADGRLALFVEFPLGSGSALYARETDGSPPVRLGEGVSFSALALSPDKAWVLAKRDADPQPAVLIPTGTGEVRELPGLSRCDQLAWFPDGKRILCVRTQESVLLIHHVETSATRTIRLGTSGPEKLLTAGSVSPDGKRIPFQGPGGTVWLCEADSGEWSRTLAEGPQQELIGWTADGSSLLVSRRGDLPARIERLELATGRRTLWKEIPAPESGVWRVSPIRVSPDGRSYAYSYYQILSDLYVVEGLR